MMEDMERVHPVIVELVEKYQDKLMMDLVMAAKEDVQDLKVRLVLVEAVVLLVLF